MTNRGILLEKLKAAVAKELEATVEVLRYLREAEAMRLYAELGYNSMFVFCVKELGLSEGSANRKIAAMRLMRSTPLAEKKIESGALSVCNAARVEYLSRKVNMPKMELIALVENKSTQGADLAIAKLFPELPKREKLRTVNEEVKELRVNLGKELQEKLEQCRALLSHVKPNMTYAELIEQLADRVLKKPNPRKVANKPSPRKVVSNLSPRKVVSKGGKQSQNSAQKQCSISTPMKKRRAYISKSTRREAFARAKNQCEYVDQVTKHRCQSTYLLELDHIRPLAIGGKESPENYRILCKQHNLLAAEKILGREKIQRYRLNDG